MEIRRKASSRNDPLKILVPEREISQIWNIDEKLGIRFRVVRDENHDNVHHDYTVTLTPDDIGKIMGAISKQALKKIDK